jgi:hypothetical protein
MPKYTKKQIEKYAEHYNAVCTFSNENTLIYKLEDNSIKFVRISDNVWKLV